MYSKMRTSIFISLLATTFAQTSVTLKDCSVSGSLFHIEKLTFDPSTPIPGQDGILTTTYTVPSVISGGQTHYSCSLNGLPVYDEKFDICSQTTCPITIGEHADISISSVPSTSGKIDCTILWTDSASQPLMCIEMIFKLI